MKLRVMGTKKNVLYRTNIGPMKNTPLAMSLVLLVMVITGKEVVRSWRRPVPPPATPRYPTAGGIAPLRGVA
jgi:hypothetical protein